MTYIQSLFNVSTNFCKAGILAIFIFFLLILSSIIFNRFVGEHTAFWLSIILTMTLVILCLAYNDYKEERKGVKK